MAKQKGIVKLEGTIGDITFFKTQDGYMAREHTPMSKDRIKNDPAFQRTRENYAEFGRAGKGGKVLRSAFRSLLQNTADSRMTSRLTAEMLKVVRADVTSERGKRNVLDGETELLQGFEFNLGGKLGTTLFAPFTATIDRASGKLSISIPPFVPVNMIVAPAGSTHYRIISAGAAIDFEGESFQMEEKNSLNLPLDGALTTAILLESSVAANSTAPLFLVLGIEFYQEVNVEAYSLKNGAFNALQLVKVDGGN